MKYRSHHDSISAYIIQFIQNTEHSLMMANVMDDVRDVSITREKSWNIYLVICGLQFEVRRIRALNPFCFANRFQISDDDVQGDVPFSIRDGKTYINREGEWELFGDFTLKIWGEISSVGFWVCYCGSRVLGRLEER